MADLIGAHSYQLDAKGRMSLPGRFREAFDGGAVITLGHDGCLFAFPREEFDRRAREIDSVPLSDEDGRAYARMFYGNAEPADLDKQGRLLVSQRLRSVAGVGREVVVLGVRDRMEIWDRGAWDRYAETHAGAYQAGTLYPGRRQR